MAAKDGEGFRLVVRLLACGGAFQEGTPIDDGDSIALTGEAVGGGEAGCASTKNHNGLSVCGRHENRERSQTQAARANR